MLCFAALGAGNGALFQLVPLRWPLTTAVAGSMIGEIGALGGGFLPNAMGQSKQFLGTYLWGFVAFARARVAMLVHAARVQIRWTRTWAEKGGRARVGETPVAPAIKPVCAKAVAAPAVGICAPSFFSGSRGFAGTPLQRWSSSASLRRAQVVGSRQAVPGGGDLGAAVILGLGWGARAWYGRGGGDFWR